MQIRNTHRAVYAGDFNIKLLLKMQIANSISELVEVTPICILFGLVIKLNKCRALQNVNQPLEKFETYFKLKLINIDLCYHYTQRRFCHFIYFACTIDCCRKGAFYSVQLFKTIVLCFVKLN